MMDYMRLEQYKFLVELRDSGVTNMWDAGPYLAEACGLDRREAKKIVVDWFQTFVLSKAEQPDDGR
jgi:hypothetical protein